MPRNLLMDAFPIYKLGFRIPMVHPMGIPSTKPGYCLSVKSVPTDMVPKDCVSAVENPIIAKLLSAKLKCNVSVNRISSIEIGDIIYLAQYDGPVLNSFTTELPKGGVLRFYRIAHVTVGDDAEECEF